MRLLKLFALALAAAAPAVAMAEPPAAPAWKPVPGKLMSAFASDVKPDAVLPEYPRPQLVRARWQNLNGLWDYALAKVAAPAPQAYAGKILVPFPLESALSGVKKPASDERLWYRRPFTVPAEWAGERVVLHFGAVNFAAQVLVNGKPVGTHTGGFDAFRFDVTDALTPGENTLTVGVTNPVKTDVLDAQVVGKQRLKPGGIFYTSATGIWQTVWLEPVPAAHVASLRLTPDLDAAALKLTVNAAGGAGAVRVVALEGGKAVGAVEGKPGAELTLPVKAPHPWTPDDPFLYDLKVTLVGADGKAGDAVGSYFAMRKISLGKDEQGRNRILLNNKFVFQVGALDQGYWPDGLFTAPTDAALKSDVVAAKKLGFNLLRKHAKVEPQRWYYWTDKLGVLVWQDMPQMFSAKGDALSAAAKKQFEAEWREIMAEFHNSPSIVVWTTFNEGWGQHDTEKVVALTKQLDPSRLVNNASGWTDKNVGDIDDLHAYPDPKSNLPSAARASACGEFGGLGMSVEGHMWAKGAWGYQGVYSKGHTLTRHYQDLLKQCYKLRDEKGMSALVYTQLTDVEEEVNGLLTYDRAVVKPYADIVAAANLGKFLPLPPNADADLVPTSQDEPATWRYTFDNPVEGWADPGFNDRTWRAGEGGFGNDAPGVRTPWKTADIWIRREFTLPNAIPEKLEFLVQHDEDAQIYVNGVEAATVTGYVGEYKRVALSEAGRKALRPGKNTLAAHCQQTVGGQAIDVGLAEVKGAKK